MSNNRPPYVVSAEDLQDPTHPATRAMWAGKEEQQPQSATDHRADLLDRMMQTAKELPKIIELEHSGVRDGNGFWLGSDALGGTIDNLSRDCKELAGPPSGLGTLVWIPHDGPVEVFGSVEPRSHSFEFWQGGANEAWTKIRMSFGGGPDDEPPF